MNENFKSIKNWASEERPREKMIEKGPAALSNAEILAILINTGTVNRSALDIARELMEINHQNLLELSKMNFAQLKQIKGLGEKKAITLLAALEIGKRRQLSAALVKPVVKGSRDAYEMLAPYFVGKTNEEFYAIFLMNNGNVIAIEHISKGGLTGTIADSRVIFSKALELKSVTRIIVSHNHPSGNVMPSEIDKKLTQKLYDAGKLLEIVLDDHIIIGHNHYYSFADEGALGNYSG